MRTAKKRLKTPTSRKHGGCRVLSLHLNQLQTVRAQNLGGNVQNTFRLSFICTLFSFVAILISPTYSFGFKVPSHDESSNRTEDYSKRLDQLFSQLHSQDTKIRQAASNQLADYGMEPQIAAVFLMHFSTKEVKEAILSHWIGEKGWTDDISNENTHTTTGYAYSGGFDIDRTIPVFRSALRQPGLARSLAIEMLRRIGGPAAARAIPDVTELLKNAKGSEEITPLLKFLSEDGKTVRRLVPEIGALLQTLYQTHNKPDPDDIKVRLAVVSATPEILSRQEAVSALEKLFPDEPYNIKVFALKSLEYVGGAEADAALKRLQSTETGKIKELARIRRYHSKSEKAGNGAKPVNINLPLAPVGFAQLPEENGDLEGIIDQPANQNRITPDAMPH